MCVQTSATLLSSHVLAEYFSTIQGWPLSYDHLDEGTNFSRARDDRPSAQDESCRTGHAPPPVSIPS